MTLTIKERLRVLADQIVALIQSSRRQSMAVGALANAFLHQHGYALKPEAYECDTLEELMSKISHAVRVSLSLFLSFRNVQR